MSRFDVKDDPMDAVAEDSPCVDAILGVLVPEAARVACFLPKPPKESRGGIVLPSAAHPEHRGIALVVGTGPDCVNTFLGQHVVFAHGFGVPVLVESASGELVEIVLVNEEDIVGRFEPFS